MQPLCLDDSTAEQQDWKAYLCIEAFIQDFVTAQALFTALKLGLIKTLSDQPRSEGALQQSHPKVTALSMLLQQLIAANVIEQDDQLRWQLTTDFSQTLPFQDLLLSKLEFANLLAPDLLEHYTLFLEDMPRFIQQAKVFELFAYNRCFEVTPENITATRRWMRFTTCLTRYEGRVIAKNADLSHIRNHLDIGGNSGEFALQLCKANPALNSTIIDLPVVCEVGRSHIKGEKEADRINFKAADALVDKLPQQQDLVTFKSILHDWPIEACAQFIRQAASTLNDQGEILICERGPLDLSRPVPYGLLPMLLFNRSFREPNAYIELLESNDFNNIEIETIQLETPFFLIRARR